MTEEVATRPWREASKLVQERGLDLQLPPPNVKEDGEEDAEMVAETQVDDTV